MGTTPGLGLTLTPDNFRGIREGRPLRDWDICVRVPFGVYATICTLSTKDGIQLGIYQQADL